jgi:hypothetical protein
LEKYMKKITVETIVDRMVLAKDICSPAGNVILSSGTELSVSLGRRLKNWGVISVFIESQEETIPEKSVIKISEDEIDTILREKFSEYIENPLMKKIFYAVKKHQFQKQEM